MRYSCLALKWVSAPRAILLCVIHPVVMPTVRLLDDAGNQKHQYGLLSNFHTRLRADKHTLLSSTPLQSLMPLVDVKDLWANGTEGSFDKVFSLWSHSIISENLARYWAASLLACCASSYYYK